MTEENLNNNYWDDENQSKNKKSEGFDVPKNYFDSLSSRIFKQIEKEDELAEFKILSTLSKESPFTLPESYFNSSEVKLESLSYEQLDLVEKKLNMRIPYHYFELTESRIIDKVKLLEEIKEFPLLSSLQFNAPPTEKHLPINYFEDFEKTILAKINLLEELNEFSLLNSLEKANPFIVSEAYFEDIHINVMNRINAPHKENILEIIWAFIKSKNFAYSFVTLVVLGIILPNLFREKTATTTPSDCNTLACLDRNEIINSYEINSMDESALIDLIDIKTLSDTIGRSLQNTHLKKEKMEYVIDNLDAENIIEEF